MKPQRPFRGPVDPHCQFIWPEDKLRSRARRAKAEFGYWTVAAALFVVGVWFVLTALEDLVK